MRGLFDAAEAEPARESQETELTLSSAVLLGIAFGLVLLCGVCFGLGYWVGHRGAPAAVQQAVAGVPSSPLGDSSKPKPSATTPANRGQQAPLDASDPAIPADAGSTPNSGAQASEPAGGATQAAQAQEPAPQPAVASGPQIRPALSAHSYAPPAPLPGGVAPAIAQVLPSGGALMVQIAAVGNAEDALVLGTALRKRGYPVTAQRDAADGLIHVRIGPFGSRDEANNWRQKLLNDGYNAIVQP
jgi:cell division septation protein DedD